MVVLFQFPITRWIERYRPLLVMTAGTLLYAVGFALYGFTSLYFMFLVAMVIITIGEMFVSPVGQAIVTRLAPEDMRGRYMAVFGFSWMVPYAIGPYAGRSGTGQPEPELVVVCSRCTGLWSPPAGITCWNGWAAARVVGQPSINGWISWKSWNKVASLPMLPVRCWRRSK